MDQVRIAGIHEAVTADQERTNPEKARPDHVGRKKREGHHRHDPSRDPLLSGHLEEEDRTRVPALALFEKLRNLLNLELGVEPLEETVRLYDEILAQDMATNEIEDRTPLGPIIPMVGRGKCFSQLQENWNRVR